MFFFFLFSFHFAIAIEIQNLKEETKDDSVESWISDIIMNEVIEVANLMKDYLHGTLTHVRI